MRAGTRRRESNPGHSRPDPQNSDHGERRKKPAPFPWTRSRGKGYRRFLYRSKRSFRFRLLYSGLRYRLSNR
jgi:hypothetical protein